MLFHIRKHVNCINIRQATWNLRMPELQYLSFYNFAFFFKETQKHY